MDVEGINGLGLFDFGIETLESLKGCAMCIINGDLIRLYIGKQNLSLKPKTILMPLPFI